ncbi:MAG: hypothetical protein ACKV2V_10715 [Blastocatellia bacterium]
MQAEAEAALFLSDNLPDRLTPGEPEFDDESYLWRVPVLLSYPILGVLGQVGEICCSAASEQVVSHTPVAEMRATALRLAEQNKDAIETAVF